MHRLSYIYEHMRYNFIFKKFKYNHFIRRLILVDNDDLLKQISELIFQIYVK